MKWLARPDVARGSS